MIELVKDDAEVRALAQALREAGSFALDLEFVSDGRYVPELGLVQVAWGDLDAPAGVAVDPLAADPAPVLALIADPAVETIVHGGQADVALIAYRFGFLPQALVDTQIAAAFTGLGEQVGFGSLVERLTGRKVDKGAQFTDWLRRPLSERQLTYALDDVLLLLPAWKELHHRLVEADRLTWVLEESATFATQAAQRLAPEETWRKVSGHAKLSDVELGRLRALGIWLEETALRFNKPPSWILPDRVMLALARRPPRDARELADMRAMPGRTGREFAGEILEALERGAAEPVELPGRSRRKPAEVDALSPLVSGIVQAKARAADIASRFVATRSDIEALLRWWIAGEPADEQGRHRILGGWRRSLAGDDVLAFLEGERALVVDWEAPSALRLVDPSA